MRINFYAEELPDERRVERVETTAGTGRTFFGARIFLKSPDELHDRTAVTFWGPKAKVAALLREAADSMDSTVDDCTTEQLATIANRVFCHLRQLHQALERRGESIRVEAQGTDLVLLRDIFTKPRKE